MDNSSNTPGLLDGLSSLSMIIASLVAIWGINAWKREHVGRRRMELAEETLTLFYEARDVINGARSIFGSTADYREAVELEREETGATPTAQDALVVSYRLFRRKRFFARIRARRYRFAAVFGRGTERPFYDLANLRAEIEVSEGSLRRINRNPQARGPNVPPSLSSEIDRLNRIIYCGGGADDPTTQRLDEIVKQIEAVCRPVIEGAGRGWGRSATERVRRAVGSTRAKPRFARLWRIWTGDRPGAAREGRPRVRRGSSAP